MVEWLYTGGRVALYVPSVLKYASRLATIAGAAAAGYGVAQHNRQTVVVGALLGLAGVVAEHFVDRNEGRIRHAVNNILGTPEKY